MMKTFFLGTAAAVATSLGAANAVVLELSLGVDVSGSVNPDEFDLQRDGYVAAFESQDVQDAIEASEEGIAVNFFYFSEEIAEVVGWTQLETAADAQAFADAIANASRPDNIGFRTGLANAIRFGIESITENSFDATRQVIDISGDGRESIESNESQPVSPSVRAARDAAESEGITVNGLAINNDSFPTLDEYFENNVITSGDGVDGFVLAATFDSFRQAIVTKIDAEIRDENPVIPLPAPAILMLSGLAGVMGWKRKKAA